MSGEGVVIPGESGGASLNPELHRAAVEERARSKGWKPLSEYDKDPADWVDAPEFVGRQKLYDKIHDLSRHSRKLEKDLEVISKHFTDVEEKAYKRALADLQAKQSAAVEEQDVAVVKATTEEIVKLQAEHAAKAAAAPAQQAGESPEFVQWKNDNTWFDNDIEMREDAISLGIGIAMKNPNKSQTEVLQLVSDKIKKAYPEKFPKRAIRKEPLVESASGGPTNGQPAGQKGKKLTEADLNEQERSVMNTFLKRGVFKAKAAQEKISEKEYYLREVAKNRE